MRGTNVRKRGVLVAAMAMAVLALAGCSDKGPEGTTIGGNETTSAEATPEGTPSPTASARSRPSPDETITTQAPGKIDPETERSAKAFVMQYMTAYDQATLSGDLSKVQKLVKSSCTGCNEAFSFVRSVYDKGGKIVGGEFSNPKLSVQKAQDGTITVLVTSTVKPFKVLDKSGKTVGSGPAETSNSTFYLEKVGTGWVIRNWNYQ
jgi:hypothetical protein